MGILETVLLVAGVILAVLSFIIPMTGEEVPQETKKLAEDEIKTLVEQEMDSIRNHVDDVVDEAVGYAVEKTERSLERLTNEKIMAVNEYSDTVLQEIHKNHEEAVFLYDMLNNKHTGLKNMLTEINNTVQEAEETRRETESLMDSIQDMKTELSAMKEMEAVTPVQFAEPEMQAQIVQPPASAQYVTPEQPVQAAVPVQHVGAEQPSQVAGSIQPVTPEQPIQRVQPFVPIQAVPTQTAQPMQQGQFAPLETAPTSMNLNFMSEGQDNKVNNNDMILEMHRKGKSNVAIAKELGLGVGEVKLVIDLYKNL